MVFYVSRPAPPYRRISAMIPASTAEITAMPMVPKVHFLRLSAAVM